MKKLLKIYGLNSDMQYYEIIVESYINGQRNQAHEQFSTMPKQNRKDFIVSSITFWQSGLTNIQIANLVNLI